MLFQTKQQMKISHYILLEVNDRMAEKQILISSFECQLRKKLYLAKITNKPRKIKKVYGNGRYEGEMKDDIKNGLGVCYFNDGHRYEGNLKDGDANGKGIYYFNNGGRYEGNFKDDKMNGQGIFYFKNGDRYEGEMKDNKYNGQGIHYFKNGTQISQVWHQICNVYQ